MKTYISIVLIYDCYKFVIKSEYCFELSLRGFFLVGGGGGGQAAQGRGQNTLGYLAPGGQAAPVVWGGAR